MAHIADAFVVACIDFRFQESTQEWLKENMKGKKYDYVGFAGATKDLKTVIGQLDISVRLHHTEQVVLIHHENCGAYGDESTEKRHEQDLHKAKDTILSLYPDLQVDLYYLKLNGKMVKVS